MSDLSKLTIAEARDRLRGGRDHGGRADRGLPVGDRGGGGAQRLRPHTPEIALKQAGAADARLKAGDAPAMCGIPLGIKDLFCTEGVASQAASRILENFRPNTNRPSRASCSTRAR
jgi:aspartyl-tRNA(Asn)/glutamyl-tRNA(Gln) amidotransferase subunit A